jgi:hypothetical protein
MQGYSKGSMGPFMTVHNNGKEEASMQGYSKGSLGTIMTVHINDQV